MNGGPMPEGLHCGYHINLDGDAPKIFNLHGDEVFHSTTALVVLRARPVTGLILKDALRKSAVVENIKVNLETASIKCFKQC